MRQVKAVELILDYELYPRNNVDSHNVRAIIDAMDAGVEMPPVVVDRATKKVVDGFHRVIAAIRKGGPTATIGVVEKSYPGSREMFADAMRYNSSHGAQLDPCDRARCAIIAQRLRITTEVLADALHMSVTKVTELVETRRAFDKAGTPVPLKRTVARQFVGRKLTKRQEEANQKLSGMNQVFYVNQIIELIEADMLDTEDDGLMTRLRLLGALIKKVAGRPVAAR